MAINKLLTISPQSFGVAALGLTFRSGSMVNQLFLKHKTLGSAALRCGASMFGIKSMGNFSTYPSLFVAVFKSEQQRNNFLSYLRKNGLQPQTDYYYKFRLKGNQFYYMAFVKLYKFIPSEKLAFNSFRQFCSTDEIKIYSNPSMYNPINNPKINYR